MTEIPRNNNISIIKFCCLHVYPRCKFDDTEVEDETIYYQLLMLFLKLQVIIALLYLLVCALGIEYFLCV